MWDPNQMAPDTREGPSRDDQLDALATALEMAQHPPTQGQEDQQRDFIFNAVFNCTDNVVVARAVSAAMRNTGWGYIFIEKGAEAREEVNRQRAMMARMFGDAGPRFSKAY